MSAKRGFCKVPAAHRAGHAQLEVDALNVGEDVALPGGGVVAAGAGPVGPGPPYQQAPHQGLRRLV